MSEGLKKTINDKKTCPPLLIFTKTFELPPKRKHIHTHTPTHLKK
jgi:hypothetical protein